MAGRAWACVSWFAAQSQAASGNGRSTSASARHRSLYLSATSGSACEAGLACQGCEPDPGVPGHSRCRWPGPATAKSAEAHRWRRRPVDLGCQAASATPQCMVYRFFWPPFFFRRQKRLGLLAPLWGRSSKYPDRSVLPDSGECANAQEPARTCRHPASHETAATPSTRGRTALAGRARLHLSTVPRKCR